MSELILEDTLVKIGYYSISNIPIKTLVFPITFSHIEYASVSSCSQLENVTFKGNMFYSVANAFYNCPKLTNIIYLGVFPVRERVCVFNLVGKEVTIRVCEDYKLNSFSGSTSIIKQDLCPAINMIKKCTCNKNSKTYQSYCFICFFCLYINIIFF